MEQISTLNGRRPQDYPGYRNAELLADLIVGAMRLLGRLVDNAVRAHRSARTRRELHNLNDHFLRDIGLDRNQIDRLFG